MPGCEREQIDVRATEIDEAYGRRDLVTAVDRFTQSDRSPARFRELAVTITGLSPKFNDGVAQEAERNLVLLGLRTLEEVVSQPPDAQLELLGTTVWPTALGAEPLPGETASAYLERLCSSQLALRCKDVVPEYRALILASLVWTRLEERARAAVRACETCRGPEFTDAMTRYEQHARSLEKTAQQALPLARPSRWPRGVKRALPWSGAPVLSMNEDGEIVLDGRPVIASELADVLAEVRTRSEVLGLHVEPSTQVKHLRRLMADATTATFAQLAFQVRAPEYPYALAEYRIALRKNGERPVRVRDIDTVQVLVHALDVLTTKGEQAPPLLF